MGRCGKADDKGGSLSVGIVVAENFSPVLLHDAVADTEAEAGSLANLFGSEEGIEDAIRMRDAVAIVAERNFDGVAGFSSRNFDTSGAADLVYCVVSIIQDVQKNLLQLMSVTVDVRESLVKVFDDVDAVAVEVVRTQLNRATKNYIDLHRVALGRHLAGKAEQILHDLFGALGFLQDDAEILAGSFWKIGASEE